VTTLTPKSTLPLKEVQAKWEWTVQKLVDELADLEPHVLFYGSKPNTANEKMELWRTPDDNFDMLNGAPPVHTPLFQALPFLHEKWMVKQQFVPGKYLRLLCEKEDCNNVTIKLVFDE
jgi:hypothetical protein